MGKQEFICSIEKADQARLLETAAQYTSPDPEPMQKVYDSALDALSRLTTPQFDDEATAAYAFQALFEAQLMSEWLKWLDSQLREQTNSDIYLSEIGPEEQRRLSGGAIKGQNAARLLTRTSDAQTKLVVFTPATKPVELFPRQD